MMHRIGAPTPAPDFAIASSRALAPNFYRAPAPQDRPHRPKEYQYAGAEYCLARDNALLGDAPGLGKSSEAILISNAIEAENTLIVCPASLILNWEREIEMWSTIEDITTFLSYPILKSKDGVDPLANYVIVSYDMLRNQGILDGIMDTTWDHLILDEAHYLKDPKGNKRTKVICAPDLLPSVVGRITMASGTILPNQPIECYNAIRLLDHSVIDYVSLEGFREYYYDEGGGMVRGPWFNPKTQAWETQLHWSEKVRNVPRNLDDLQYRLRKGVMVRRLTSEVLTELPPMQWHPFPLATTPAMRKAMKHPGWKRAEQLYELDSRAFDTGVPVDGAVSTARRLLGEAKGDACADYVIDLLNSGVEKIVVAAWHLSVLALLRERLKKYSPVYMDGSTSIFNKQHAVDTFQNDPKCRIIIGQTKPLGEGHTLTAAQDVVVCEPDWVPGKNDQLLRRVCRMGQKGTYTLGHIPVVPDTMDERILGTSITKDQNIYQALDA